MRRQGMHMAVDSATSRSNTAAAAALKSMLTESSEVRNELILLLLIS